MFKLLKLFKSNSIVKYISSRYIIYLIQFINTLLLAKKLDPFNFGVWAFIQLIILYFSQINFGIPSTLNALASIHKQKTKFVTLNFNASLTLIGVLSLIVTLLFFFNLIFDFDFGEKYHFKQNSIYVLIIIVLGYFNTLFLNIYRIYNKLGEITFFQSSVPFTIFVIALLFNGPDLITYFLIGMILSNSAALVLFINNCPLKIRINYSRKLMSQLQKSGIYFFIYNASFYLILISTRSIISFFYTVEEFGFFNFAFLISNVIFLLLNSFTFLIFPKIINKLSSLNDVESYKLILFIRSKYVMLTNILSHFAIMCFPLFILFFPKYEVAIYTFNLITLTQLIYSNCLGSPELLMARRKEKKIAISALLCLILNVIATLLIVKLFDVSFSQVIIGSTLTYFIYIISINRLSLKEISQYKGMFHLMKSTFSFNLLIPFLVSFILSLLEMSPIYYSIPFVIYLLINYKLILTTLISIKTIIQNPNVINI